MEKARKRKDVLTPEQRSYCMSQIRSVDTKVEILLRSSLHSRGLRFRKNVRSLPGCPDIVFSKRKVAIFVDGNFWHGYRFATWRKRLSSFWQTKIENNKRRDKKNTQKLRRKGWLVIRLWEEQVLQQLDSTTDYIVKVVESRKRIQTYHHHHHLKLPRYRISRQ